MTAPDDMTRGALESVIDDVAHYLPAQGPISVFIHHNTLHAFEDQPFETAVESAADLFGAEPWLAEARYRDELACGRIRESHVAQELRERLGEAADERLAGVVTRLGLYHRVTIHGIEDARGAELSWALSEGDALRRFRDDVPTDAREVIAAARGWTMRASDEPRAVRALWDAARSAIRRAPPRPVRAAPKPVRPRDYLLAVHDIDIDEWIHPPLIRFVAAYLDQGLSQWPLAGREAGMFACFLENYHARLVRLAAPWCGELRAVIEEERSRADAGASLAASLAVLGVSEAERFEFLVRTALALRGFAGMVRQIEERPDRVPARAVPARLVDFLAIRLIFERAALRQAVREREIPAASLAVLRTTLASGLPSPEGRTTLERVWQLFQVAQLCGLDTAAVSELSPADIGEIETSLEAYDARSRRQVFHRAYERHLRQRFYDALQQNRPEGSVGSPKFQAVFCIDDREESIRRHIEEVEPAAETHGTAGFHGVAMYFRGATDAHPRPLCPVVVRPRHFVPESGSKNGWARRGRGLLDRSVYLGSHTLLRGAIVMTTLGALAFLPLLLRVMLPWLRPSVAHELARRTPDHTRLQLERVATPPPIGNFSGFTVEEMVAIVESWLENIGLHVAGRLAPLVFVFGHGSVSLNNPHKSAYDCGACGGGKGGPNARAFAQMANDPAVRAGLAARGVVIPDETWFVGGERNTSDSSMHLFDLPHVPARHRQGLAHARAVFERARRLEAHERCRRFDLGGPSQSAQAALRHVEGRSDDLAQPRPECGHATNAVCFVGRRSRTRGIFLDRRAFLVSYDAATDGEGSPVLTRILDAIVPVISGISLEYWFSYVDQAVYGCGTKLPHNVTALLGVMDGAQSDLRTGLPWQMVELHEPVRMSFVVEDKPERLSAIFARDARLRGLADRGWFHFACLDPDGSRLWEWRREGFVERRPERALSLVRGGSRAVYTGKPGHLPFCRVVERDDLGSVDGDDEGAVA